MAELPLFFQNKNESTPSRVFESRLCCSLAIWHQLLHFFLDKLEFCSVLHCGTERNNIFYARNVFRRVFRTAGKEAASNQFVFWRCIFLSILDFLKNVLCCIRADVHGCYETSLCESNLVSSKCVAVFFYKFPLDKPRTESGLLFYFARASSTILRMTSDTLTPSSLARFLIHSNWGFVKTMPRCTPVMLFSYWFNMDHIRTQQGACQ